LSPIHEYRWTVRTEVESPSPEKSAAVKTLSEQLTVSPVLAEILVNRKIDTFEKARAFFRPHIEDFNDPFLMKDMDRAVDRILKALRTGEQIVVYGDYDVDGTDSTAMLWSFLHSIGANARSFVPDRVIDGYGLSSAGIDRVHGFQSTLLIAVDCGITAVQQVEYARSLGIDVVICDHHEPGDFLPNAAAVLDALQAGCKYPFKYLCGCGVAFKLIQALLAQKEISEKLGVQADRLLEKYLQYVTLATTADIVPLIDENRTLVQLGLELINTDPLPGIRALIETSGVRSGKISAGQIVFVLAPRINAVGRLGDANRAVDLLTCTSYERALELSRVMEDENSARRKIDEETYAKAQIIVENMLETENNSAIVLHEESWHPGVIGIVASRLVERYYRPTILMTTIDGVAKGSARSISGFNIHDALKRCENKLIQFGGHKYAAGLTVELDKVQEFRDAFNLVAGELMTEELLTPEIRIDAEVRLSDLTPKFIRVLGQFAPFGADNPRPIFVTRGVEVMGQPRIVGKNHLRFKVRSGGAVVDTIGFNLGNLISRVKSGNKVDLAFSLDESDFSSETAPQLKLRDIK
jgi:single-stranded-DNA-specific exonuclease